MDYSECLKDNHVNIINNMPTEHHGVFLVKKTLVFL